MRQRWRGKHCLQAVNEDFESAVEHFFNFGRFCSTLAAAVGGFGVGGRQNSVEKSAFCLLWRGHWICPKRALFGFKSAAAAKEGLRLTKKPDKRLTH